MPIEIRELHIRVNVTSTSPGDGASAGTFDKGTIGKSSGKERQELIAECVEQVMKILDAKTER